MTLHTHLAMPRPVSDLDQRNLEGQAYPVGMDSWLQGKSKKRKEAKMAQTERWIQRWLLCQSKFPLVHGDSPNPSSQDPPGEVLRHTGHFQGYLQLFIIPKLHFGQTSLLISLSCTWTFHHPSFCSGLLPLGMPLFKVRLNSTSSIEVFLPCLPQIISYLSEATPSIPFINQLFCLSPIVSSSVIHIFYSYLTLRCRYISFVYVSSLKGRNFLYYPHISQA